MGFNSGFKGLKHNLPAIVPVVKSLTLQHNLPAIVPVVKSLTLQHNLPAIVPVVKSLTLQHNLPAIVPVVKSLKYHLCLSRPSSAHNKGSTPHRNVGSQPPDRRVSCTQEHESCVFSGPDNPRLYSEKYWCSIPCNC